jgi:3-dehydroquinate synthase class II
MSSTTMIVVPSCPLTGPSRTGVPFRFLVGLFAALLLLGLPFQTTLKAQEQRKSHVPVIDKITSGGPTQQAFSGIVKSIDLRGEVLNVDNINGKSTEVFPVKKKVHVVTADGEKLELSRLKPGSNVIVYYDQKADRRTVTRIVVLAGGPVKKKTPAS